MSFLAPLAFWIAALVVPALLILYFLKLRRREQKVPSTLLWRRAVQDLQVNAPFQRLRKNLLLLLQLLILALVITALARPVVETPVGEESSVVILIDRSASMNTLEGKQTRFELAKEQAVRLVKTLRRTRGRWWALLGRAQPQARVMVIAFADRAVVVAPFTTDMNAVSELIDKLTPTDGQSNIREALELAEAYMTQTRLEQTPQSARPTSRIVLFSDGVVRGAEEVVLRAGSLTLIPIGQRRDNVGITALRIQRSYEKPEVLNAFLQVQNFGPEAVTTDVALYLDGRLSTVEPVSLGPARESAAGQAEAEQAATASLSFEFVLERAALLEARLARDDALTVDNQAFAVVPEPRKMRVLLVSKGNFFLESALRYLPLESFEYLTPEQYAADPRRALLAPDGQPRFDVVIFDKYATGELPMGSYMFIGAAPQLEEIQPTGELGDHALHWWDETHPILRHVTLEYVYAAKGLVFKVPAQAEKLIEGPAGPVLFRYARDGRHYLVLTFAIEESTWWSKPGFPVFMYNAIRYMGSGGALAEREALRPGDPLRIPLPTGTDSATLLRPDGQRVRLSATGDEVARYAATHQVGVYRVEDGVPGRDLFAVNLADPFESNIRPRTSFPLGGEGRVEVGRAIETATPEIWRWFVGAALLLLLLEWYIYTRRVRI